jgi:hypothetical protein
MSVPKKGRSLMVEGFGLARHALGANAHESSDKLVAELGALDEGGTNRGTLWCRGRDLI